MAAILTSDEHRLRWAAAPEVAELPSAVAAAPDTPWAERFPAPARPWTPDYTAGHTALVAAAIDDGMLGAAAVRGDALPDGYAVGYDERTIEYPWLFGLGFGGRVLDAGSTFNHPHILDRALPLVDELTILTLAPEAHAFPLRGISYLYGDVRELPFRDGWFDTVVSLSTLEHVGMDNAPYGVGADAASDPGEEAARAARELRRVVAPGGRILFSVPFGRREDYGWFRQFDRDDLERLTAAFDARASHASFFAYGPNGWQCASAVEAADLSYHDAHADPSPAPDGAAAARAVACVVLDL